MVDKEGKEAKFEAKMGTELEEPTQQALEGTVKLPKETIEFFNGDEIRARVFYEKYALRNEKGQRVENTPIDMWNRLAKELASVETTPEKRKEWEEKFKFLLYNFRFVPGGRIMFGAGQTRRSTLLNCYVIPVREDSIEAIFDWCKEAARTYSYGGGVGTDISVLRPRGTPVNNSAVFSTGAVSFMNIMSETTHTIGQSGRRGALMITISVDHPDIYDFITVKRNLAKVRYANISVRITDEFMQAVEQNKEFALRFKNEKVNIEKKVNARQLWSELVQSARDWAEPGLIFWDTVKRYSPSEYNGMEVITTNPCSEQPLDGYNACDLGSLNLSAFVQNPFSDSASLDWKTLEVATRYAVRFLDNVLDYNLNKHPLKEQSEKSKASRRIGLGVTGLADMFVKLKIKYDSDRALAFADDLFNKIKNFAYDESIEIAREKGTFLQFDKEKHLSMPFIKTLSPELKDKIAIHGIRNVCILTIPPVGSGSILVGTSSGIEPIFAFSYTRRSESMSQEYFKVYHPLVIEYMHMAGMKSEQELPEFFVPAHKIKPEFRVKMQGVIQKHIDSAISSTVNLPEDTTVDQVAQIYMQAWKAGCKGITVYREGSREGVLITEEQQQAKGKKVAKHANKDWKRPSILTGQTVKIKTPQGSLYVTGNFEGSELREVFITLGTSGSEEKSYSEAIGKLISRYLQMGGDVKDVIESLKGIKSNSSIAWDRGMKLYSIPDSIAKALEIMMGMPEAKTATPLSTSMEEKAEISQGYQMPIDAKENKENFEAKEIKASKCPSCKESALVNENGCYTCKICGYTKCE